MLTRLSFLTAVLGIMLMVATVDAMPSSVPKAETCISPGLWRTAASPAPLNHETLMRDMAKKAVVLLGETHDSAEHHRWQLQTVAALHALNPNMVLSFEMLPRNTQPELDSWMRGNLGEDAFLKRTRWDEVWRYEPGLYLPLFHFARMHRIPMVAMNVEQALIRKVSKDGWDAVPDDMREGVTKPEPAGTSYAEDLFEVYLKHAKHGLGDPDKQGMPTRQDEKFLRFVEAQQTWDRAMAQKIAEVGSAGGEPLVVGIVGSGHLEYGHGVPFQLTSLGVMDWEVLLPWDTDRDCDDLVFRDGTAIAGAVFGVAAVKERAEPNRPKLGVFIEKDEGGIRVGKVVEDSIAESAGIQEKDLIIEAAGLATTDVDTLISIIKRQAPGTPLPLKIRRGEETLDILTPFPPQPVD